MAINAGNIKSSSNTKRVEQAELEVGTYPCRLVGVIDKGLQPMEKWDAVSKSYVVDDEKAPRRKIMVTYEFGTEFLLDENGEEQKDKPRWLSETFPLYGLGSDLATSTKRAKAIDPTNKFGGDWLAMVGMPCNVMIALKPNGKAKVGDVAPIMKGMHYAELANDPRVFDLEEPDAEVFKSLPEWLQGDITSNLEFKGSALEAMLGGEGADPAPTEQEADSSGEGW